MDGSGGGEGVQMMMMMIMMMVMMMMMMMMMMIALIKFVHSTLWVLSAVRSIKRTMCKTCNFRFFLHSSKSDRSSITTNDRRYVEGFPTLLTGFVDEGQL